MAYLKLHQRSRICQFCGFLLVIAGALVLSTAEEAQITPGSDMTSVRQDVVKDKVQAQPTFTVIGKVNLVGEVSAQRLRILLSLSGGEVIPGFVRLDGTFTIRGIPVGLHVLEVFHQGFLFPQIRYGCSTLDINLPIKWLEFNHLSPPSIAFYLLISCSKISRCRASGILKHCFNIMFVPVKAVNFAMCDSLPGF